MFQAEIKSRIEAELTRGEAARRAGLEGRARVCARRAAGVAARAYLEQRGLNPPGTSATDVLAFLRNLPGVGPEIRRVAEHMLARVDEAFTLPVEIDLLGEARWLVSEFERHMAENNRRGFPGSNG
jgi:hypothetical protein